MTKLKEKKRFRIKFTELEMLMFVQDMLSMDPDRTWVAERINSRLEISFEGNNYNVMHAVREWLNNPARVELIEALSDIQQKGENNEPVPTA